MKSDNKNGAKVFKEFDMTLIGALLRFAEQARMDTWIYGETVIKASKDGRSTRLLSGLEKEKAVKLIHGIKEIM